MQSTKNPYVDLQSTCYRLSYFSQVCSISTSLLSGYPQQRTLLLMPYPGTTSKGSLILGIKTMSFTALQPKYACLPYARSFSLTSKQLCSFDMKRLLRSNRQL